MTLVDAFVEVIGPYADAGAKQKAVHVAKRQRDNKRTSDKAQQERKDREARNAAIVQSHQPAAVLAQQYGLTRQHIYRIRPSKQAQ
jgi:hypothetical protein